MYFMRTATAWDTLTDRAEEKAEEELAEFVDKILAGRTAVRGMTWKYFIGSREEFEKRKDDLLVFALLLGFGFFINRGVELKGLYMDDLYLWLVFTGNGVREFVFPSGEAPVLRFVFYLAAWLELFFLGNHVTWMVPFNIVLNSIIAWSLYRIFVKVSGGRKFVSLALAAAYLFPG